MLCKRQGERHGVAKTAMALTVRNIKGKIMEEKTAEEIYGLLKQSVVGKSGKIVFSLGETTVDIRTTDIVGSAIQSWLQQWLRDKEIYESTPVNTQEFPDFFLSKSNPESSMLEVKSFNYNASPAFRLPLNLTVLMPII